MCIYLQMNGYKGIFRIIERCYVILYLLSSIKKCIKYLVNTKKSYYFVVENLINHNLCTGPAIGICLNQYQLIIYFYAKSNLFSYGAYDHICHGIARLVG